jgi:hypothetical protein
MPKYLILHNALESASEIMAQSTPDEIEASIAAWLVWKEQAGKTVKFEFGMPIQAVARVAADGTTDSDNPASGYSMIEADSKADVIAALRTHPHLERAGATMDILEIIPMPEFLEDQKSY